MPDIDPSTSLWTSSETPNQSNPSILTDSPYRHQSMESKPSEQLRARELLRYYTPPSPTGPIAHVVLPPTPDMDGTPPLPTSGSQIDDVLGTHIALENRPIGGSGGMLKSSEDPALTAFAQLLALKLDCERSMISFIDRTKQCAVFSIAPV